MIHLPRRAEPPAGLRADAPSTYASEEVRAALVEDFAGKCYLCETKRRRLQTDHFKPQRSFPELKAVWENLLPACEGTCNQRRVQWRRDHGHAEDWPPGGMLDPAADDIEGRLRQESSFGGGSSIVVVAFGAVNPMDQAAAHTAIELAKIHDDSPQGRSVREDLTIRINRVIYQLHAYQVASPQKKTLLLAEVQLMLGPRAPFAGVIRSHVRGLYADRPDDLEAFGLA